MIRRSYVTTTHPIKQFCFSFLRSGRGGTIRSTSYSQSESASFTSLTNRSVLEVSGKDSTKLLQGLITNDLNLLNNAVTSRSLYSLLLNVNGRIMYDLMVYKGEGDNGYLIECDSIQCEELITLMKRYKLRSKVKFDKRTDLNIFCIFDSLRMTAEDHIKLSSHENCYTDSRLTQCGTRVLTNAMESKELVESLELSSPMVSASLKQYTEHRYRIGISEGIEEMSNGIPLEYNLAWLNGVSFNKGCYIGQELVARTHHVGVIRKRVMPLILSTETTHIVKGIGVVNEKGKKVGKLLASSGKFALGLMRLKETFNASSLIAVTPDGDINITVVKPEWWPTPQD